MALDELRRFYNTYDLVEKRDYMSKWLQQEGVVFCTDKKAIEQAEQYFFEAYRIFPEKINNLRFSALYVYEKEKQAMDLQKADAIHWHNWFIEKYPYTLCAIGLSTTAIDKGREYSIYCILHELTHFDGFVMHDEKFYNHLQELISMYSSSTGENIRFF